MTQAVLTIGELTLDDVIFEDEQCQWKQIGGGALYSALGALAWGAQVSVSATVGVDYPAEALRSLSTAGLNMDGVTRVDAQSLGLWLLYEGGGRRHQVQKESGSTFAALDEARKAWTLVAPEVDGIHIAPQTAEGQVRALQEARGRDVVVTQDILVEPFIDTSLYNSGAAIRGCTAFLPSAQEIAQLWPASTPLELFQQLRSQAGIAHLVIKRGSAGADVVGEREVVRVPALSERPVDPTGAGDAFSGGYLVGLLQTADPVEAAVFGAVSASFVVETRGALEMLEVIDVQESRRRAHRARTLTRQV